MVGRTELKKPTIQRQKARTANRVDGSIPNGTEYASQN
jgi:hypothetical protein